jgi:hypothetical protein
MEAAGSSETLETICQTIRLHIPEDSNLHSRRYENLESQNFIFIFMIRMTGKSIEIVLFTDPCSVV